MPYMPRTGYSPRAVHETLAAYQTRRERRALVARKKAVRVRARKNGKSDRRNCFQ